MADQSILKSAVLPASPMPLYIWCCSLLNANSSFLSQFAGHIMMHWKWLVWDGSMPPIISGWMYAPTFYPLLLQTHWFECTTSGSECTYASTSLSHSSLASANWRSTNTTNPISSTHPFDIYSIFIKYLLDTPYQLPSGDESKIGVVLW